MEEKIMLQTMMATEIEPIIVLQVLVLGIKTQVFVLILLLLQAILLQQEFLTTLRVMYLHLLEYKLRLHEIIVTAITATVHTHLHGPKARLHIHLAIVVVATIAVELAEDVPTVAAVAAEDVPLAVVVEDNNLKFRSICF